MGVVLAAGIALARPDAARAQVFELVGTRALGMGGAFVAVADDASAVYWNPAGLGHGALVSLVIERQEGRAWSDRRRHEASALGSVGTLAGLGTPSLGIAYYRLRTGSVRRGVPGAAVDPTREDLPEEVSLDRLVTHHAAVAFVQPFLPGVTLGTVVKYVRGSVVQEPGNPERSATALLDRAEGLSDGGDGEFDLDLGLMAVAGRLRWGLVARNLRTPTFDSPMGQSVELDRHVRTGVAWAANDGLLLAADLDVTRVATALGDRRMLAVGGQQQLGDWLGVRGGGRFNLEADDADLTGGMGLSLALGSTFWVDAQITRGGARGGERGWGISGRFGF